MGELILSKQIIWAKNKRVNILDTIFPGYHQKLLDTIFPGYHQKLLNPPIKPQDIPSFTDLAGDMIGLD